MKRILLITAVTVLMGMAARAGQVSFYPVEVFIDTGGAPLAAYQFELHYDRRAVSLVGLEGGEVPFDEAPYYDPKGLEAGRIVIAAFTIGHEAPRGRIRVARIHLMDKGAGEADLSVSLILAATADAIKIEASIELVSQKGEVR